MSRIEESIHVDVPVRVAYDQWTQFESFPSFMDGVEPVTPDRPTHNNWVTTIGGVTREFDTVITQQHPDERVAWKSFGGETRHVGVVTFHRLDDPHTRLMIQIDWDPEGLVENAGAVVGVDDHRVMADARRFKEFIEGRGAATRAWRGEVSAG